MSDIILEPVITETSLSDAKKNWYTFKSPLAANKNQLKKAVKESFKVDVLAVKTLVVKAKSKRSRLNRRLMQKTSWKKVMVKIKEGQKIEAFEGGA